MPKYIALISTPVHIPGDERSRTNPGHGYGERTEYYVTPKYFEDDTELLDWRQSWGKHINDPIVFELGKRVKFEEKLTISLLKS